MVNCERSIVRGERWVMRGEWSVEWWTIVPFSMSVAHNFLKFWKVMTGKKVMRIKNTSLPGDPFLSRHTAAFHLSHYIVSLSLSFKGGWIFIRVYNLPTYKICTFISTDSLLGVTEAYFPKDSREDDTYVFPSMYNCGQKTILKFFL